MAVCGSFSELCYKLMCNISCNEVNCIIVVAVFREVTCCFKINDKAVLILYGTDAGIFYCRKGVCYNGKSRYTESHKSADLCVVQRHLCFFISVFIVHIVDNIHCVYIKSCKPLHINGETLFDLCNIKLVAVHYGHLRT